MGLTELKKALEYNTQALQGCEDVSKWSELMIQRQHILNMIVERLELINEFKKVG